MFRKYILPIIVFIFYRTLSWTWRIQVHEPESLKQALKNNKTFIIAHWHGDELALLWIARPYRIATIASQSKDGELMSKVLRWLGARTSRGSSTRGGVQALKGLIRLLKDGGNSSFAVDGPKGPIYKVKPGVFELSRLLSCPIYAGGIACDRAIHFPKSWNKTFLPKPFAKVVVNWEGPMGPISKDKDPRNPDLALELESLLRHSQRQALNLIADKSP